MDWLDSIKSRIARVVRDGSGRPRRFDGQLVDDAARLLAEVEKLRNENWRLQSFVDHIMTLDTCNNCGAAQACEHRPEWGASVRYNCPLWRKEAEAPK